VTNALIELAAELEGEHGFPIGASEPNVAGANGEEHLIQRTERHYPGKKIFGKAALGAEVVSLNGEAEENDTVFGEERSESKMDWKKTYTSGDTGGRERSLRPTLQGEAPDGRGEEDEEVLQAW